MKRLAIPAVLVAAFLATGCADTVEVCRTYGNQTICRTENEAALRRHNQRVFCEALNNCTD